jgi:hypothetical protein
MEEPSAGEFAVMSGAEKAQAYELYAKTEPHNAEFWMTAALRLRAEWDAALAEPRSALPERIAEVIESTAFGALEPWEKRHLCRRWQAEYQKRPKRDADEVDHDEDMSAEFGRLAVLYRRIETEGWEHPDDALARFVAETRAEQAGGDHPPDVENVS